MPHFGSGAFRGYLLYLMAHSTYPDLDLLLNIVVFNSSNLGTPLPSCLIRIAMPHSLLPLYREGYSYLILGALTLPQLLAFMLLTTINLE